MLPYSKILSLLEQASGFFTPGHKNLTFLNIFDLKHEMSIDPKLFKHF